MSDKKYRATHKEEVRLSQKRYRETHAEQIRAKRREYYYAHHEESLASHRAWRLKNLESTRAKSREYQRVNVERLRKHEKEYRAAHREEILQRRHGIGIADYKGLIKKQREKCPICGKELALAKMVIDHDHTTGRVRGVLHSRCNLAIGIFGDNPRRLRIAAAYLEKHAQGVLL